GADVLHQRNILLVPVVMIVGDVAVVVVLDVPRLMRISIPDREALAVLVPGALDLIRRGAGAPKKTSRKFSWLCLLTGRFGLRRYALGERRCCAGGSKQRGAAGEFGELPTIEPCVHDRLPWAGSSWQLSVIRVLAFFLRFLRGDRGPARLYRCMP